MSSSLFVLKDQNNVVGSAGASFLAPLFSGYALEANVDIRTAEQKQAIAEYGRTAARAFSDVESALSAEFAADEREAILASAASNNAARSNSRRCAIASARATCARCCSRTCRSTPRARR